MAKCMNMIKGTRGFYTLEATVFLPLVVLAVLSLGYFMKVIGTWENCIHGAVDESAVAASKSYDRVNALTVGAAVSKRINDDNPGLAAMQIKKLRVMYSDGYTDDLTSYRITAAVEPGLPLGFSKRFELDYGIKYRGFTGVEGALNPLGAEGLSRYEQQHPVWIFPHSGEKYHTERCTYVKSAASLNVLTSALKKKYDSCGICGSGNIPAGSIVFCFNKTGTAYHRGTCSCIVRRVSVIDRSEAAKRGYAPCTKCGGGS